MNALGMLPMGLSGVAFWTMGASAIATMLVAFLLAASRH